MMGSDLGTLIAPAGTLQDLRAIDPAADLVHLGGEQWLLGVRVANPGAHERIRRQLKLLDPHKHTSHDAGKEFQLLQFYATGFRPIMVYELGQMGVDERGLPSKIDFLYIVDDFRIRDFNHRIRPDAAEAEFRNAISLDAGNRRRADRVREAMDQEGRSIWRHVMAGARGIVQRIKHH